VDVKDGVELGGEECVVNGAAELEEFYFAVLSFGGGVSADEFADAAAIEMLDCGEIEQDAPLTFVEIFADEGAEFGAAFAKLERAAHINDEDDAGKAWCGHEFNWGRSLRWLMLIGVRFGLGGRMQPLGHNNFRAALTGKVHFKFVHKGAHEKNAAAGTLQEIFIGERVGNIFNFEASALIANVDDKFFGSELKGEKDFFVALFLAAVIVGVDYTFADGHANLETVVVIKTGGAGDAGTHFLGEADTIQQRFESYLDALIADIGATVRRMAQDVSMGSIGLRGKSIV
jgi:hypothetical protein